MRCRNIVYGNHSRKRHRRTGEQGMPDSRRKGGEGEGIAQKDREREGKHQEAWWERKVSDRSQDMGGYSQVNWQRTTSWWNARKGVPDHRRGRKQIVGTTGRDTGPRKSIERGTTDGHRGRMGKNCQKHQQKGDAEDRQMTEERQRTRHSGKKNTGGSPMKGWQRRMKRSVLDHHREGVERRGALEKDGTHRKAEE